MDNNKYINLSYIKEISEGSPDLMKELINIYIQQVPSFHSQMEHYYSLGKYELLGKLAHKVKNSVAMMGIAELTSDMKELEILAQNGQKTELYPEFIKRFKDISALSVEELNTIQSTL